MQCMRLSTYLAAALIKVRSAAARVAHSYVFVPTCSKAHTGPITHLAASLIQSPQRMRHHVARTADALAGTLV